MSETFAETHRSTYCEQCEHEIKPGDDVWVKDSHAFCCEECAIAFLTEGLKRYEPDDYGYSWHFPLNWDKVKWRTA